jgi:hypothetical protein
MVPGPTRAISSHPNHSLESHYNQDTIFRKERRNSPSAVQYKPSKWGMGAQWGGDIAPNGRQPRRQNARHQDYLQRSERETSRLPLRAICSHWWIPKDVYVAAISTPDGMWKGLKDIWHAGTFFKDTCTTGGGGSKQDDALLHLIWIILCEYSKDKILLLLLLFCLR